MVHESPLETVEGMKKFPEHLGQEDFARRESIESDRANYSIEIYPKAASGVVEESEVYKSIMQGYGASGYLDLSSNDGKFKIWLGTDHMNIWFGGMKFPDDVNVKDYIIGVKVRCYRDGEDIHIDRNMVGQSCERTPDQIRKILDAADAVLKENFQKA
jgi:hypothetical protein